jgi:hypothetical protein
MTVQGYIYILVCNALNVAKLNQERHTENYRNSDCDLDTEYGDSGNTYREVLQASANEVLKTTLAKTWIEGGGEI